LTRSRKRARTLPINPERLAKFHALDLAGPLVVPRRTEQSSTSSCSATDASAFTPFIGNAEDLELDDVGTAAITFSSSAGEKLKSPEQALASRQPMSIDDAFGCRLGVVPESFALRDDLAGLAQRHGLVVLVSDLQLSERQRTTAPPHHRNR